MPDNYCISTSTSPFPLQIVVPFSGTFNVVDGQGNTYYATSTCPAITTYVVNENDNPALNLYAGIFLFLVVFMFVVWYFVARFRMS